MIIPFHTKDQRSKTTHVHVLLALDDSAEESGVIVRESTLRHILRQQTLQILFFL